VFVVAGCLPASEQSIQEEWEEWVAEHDTCAVAEDCVLVYPGCPLGCWAAVSVDAEQEATDLAADLIDDYERGGASCDYSCVQAEATCDAGTCAVVETL
jgi:hypothetical protein